MVHLAAGSPRPDACSLPVRTRPSVCSTPSREGRIVGLLADRDLAGNGVEVDFFGEKTTLPGGPALLALRSGAAFMTCAIYQRPHGRLPRRGPAAP